MNRIARRLRGVGVGADTTLTVALQIAGAVAAFVLQVVIFRVLSRDDAGFYTRTTTYLVLASAVADFGIAATVMPRLAVLGGDTPAFKAAMVIRFGAILVAWLVMSLYLLVRGSFDLLLYVNLGYFGIFVSARMIGLRQFVEILWRLQGRTYVVTAVGLADTFLLMGGIVLLAAVGMLTLERVLLLVAFSGLPGFLLIVWPLWKSGRLQRYFSISVPRRYYRTLLKASIPVAVVVIAGQIFSQLEMLVIEAYLHVSDNAGFRAATAPLTGLVFLSSAVTFALSPVVSQIDRGARRDIGADMITSVAVRLIGSMALGICAVCYLFGEELMLLFGPKYYAEVPILKIYSISNGLTFFVILFDAFLLAIGYRRQVLVAALVGLSSALVLEILFVQSYGVPGLVAAKIASQAMIVILQVRALQAELRTGAVAGLMRLAIPAGLLAVALFATAGLSDLVRVPLVLLVLGGSLLAGRIVSPAELRFLRQLRLS